MCKGSGNLFTLPPDSSGPWLDVDTVTRSLVLHELHPDDLIDFVDDAGSVALRFAVSPRG